MIVYTVHEPGLPVADPLERSQKVVFVKDGFSWPALVFGPLWLLAHRVWLPLLAFVAAYGLLELLLWLLPGGDSVRALALALASFGFGLEANTLRRWSLERKGYRQLGTVTAKTIEECEHRFFASWLPHARQEAGSQGQAQAPILPPSERALSPGGGDPSGSAALQLDPRSAGS